MAMPCQLVPLRGTQLKRCAHKHVRDAVLSLKAAARSVPKRSNRSALSTSCDAGALAAAQHCRQMGGMLPALDPMSKTSVSACEDRVKKTEVLRAHAQGSLTCLQMQHSIARAVDVNAIVIRSGCQLRATLTYRLGWTSCHHLALHVTLDV